MFWALFACTLSMEPSGLAQIFILGEAEFTKNDGDEYHSDEDRRDEDGKGHLFLNSLNSARIFRCRQEVQYVHRVVLSWQFQKRQDAKMRSVCARRKEQISVCQAGSDRPASQSARSQRTGRV